MLSRWMSRRVSTARAGIVWALISALIFPPFLRSAAAAEAEVPATEQADSSIQHGRLVLGGNEETNATTAPASKKAIGRLSFLIGDVRVDDTPTKKPSDLYPGTRVEVH